MHKQYFFNYGPSFVLSCFIQQCVYIRFACRSEFGNSNPVLRAETLVVRCQEDDSTPLINRTFRGHQDWPLIWHFIYYPLLNETTDGFIIVFWRHAASQNYSLGLSKPEKLRLNLLFQTFQNFSRVASQLWKNKTSLKPPRKYERKQKYTTVALVSDRGTRHNTSTPFALPLVW